MGTLGPTPSSVGTSFDTPADLSSVVDNGLAAGSWGYVASTDSHYSYKPLSVAPLSPTDLASRSSQGGLFPGRWHLFSGGGGGGGPLSRTFYCDPLTAVPLASQTGAISAPFATIAQAVALVLALGGTTASIRLTAGVYNEKLTIPSGAVLFDNIDIVGEGPESTRIVAPAGSAAMVWAPIGPSTPVKKFRLSGVSLEAADGIYAMILDGSNITAPGEIFGGDLAVPVVLNSLGLIFENCLILGARLRRTGFVNFIACDIKARVDLATDFLLIENGVLATAANTNFSGQNGAPAASMRLVHDDPAALRFLTLGLFGGSKIIDSAAVVLEGFPAFFMGQSCFLDTSLSGTAITASFNPLLVYIQGSCGFLGSAPVTFLLPDSDAFSEPQLFLPGATLLGVVTVDHPVGVNSPTVNLRGANCSDLLIFTGIQFVDLSGATYDQSKLIGGPAASFVLRDGIVFVDVPQGPGGPNLFKISPPLPVGTAYSVVAMASDGTFCDLSTVLGSKIETGFSLVNTSAVPFTADAQLEVRR